MSYEQEPSRARPARSRPSAREIGVFVVVVVVVVFALANLEDARISLVLRSVEMPVFFVIAAPALVAFAAGMLFQRQRQRRRR